MTVLLEKISKQVTAFVSWIFSDHKNTCRGRQSWPTGLLQHHQAGYNSTEWLPVSAFWCHLVQVSLRCGQGKRYLSCSSLQLPLCYPACLGTPPLSWCAWNIIQWWSCTTDPPSARLLGSIQIYTDCKWLSRIQTWIHQKSKMTFDIKNIVWFFVHSSIHYIYLNCTCRNLRHLAYYTETRCLAFFFLIYINNQRKFTNVPWKWENKLKQWITSIP